MKKTNVGIAMSGGVDSTACALLLREKYNVQGFFMHLAQPDFSAQKRRVEKIATQLEIPLHIIDLRPQFETCVLQYFSESYFNGLTPNPCVICNRKIKFGLFLDAVLGAGMDYMATGHYAIIAEEKGLFHLHKGTDPKKDQSYFLSRLTQVQLAKVLFPLGSKTKESIYRYVEQQGFYNFQGLESQDVCFLDDDSIGHFLDSRSSGSKQTKSGAILSIDGSILGKHNGLFNYTIGQRKGLGISSEAPLYVIRLDTANNAVIVGGNDELFCKKIRVKELHWMADEPPDLSKNYSVRIRYSHKGSDAAIRMDGSGKAEITFQTPQRAITPGQFAVIYRGTELLGSGIIDKETIRKVFITTLGCKVNQFESAAFKTAFEAAGLEIVSGQDKADIVIINSCAVTGSAGAQSRKAVRRALRMHPHAEIIITGCYAETGLKELLNEKELIGRKHRLIGNKHKDKLVATVLGHIDANADLLPGTIRTVKEISRLPVKRFSERSRAYLRVQDGCENFCTYCIVPYTRGPNRSLPLSEALDQAKIFAEEGHREIVLTGIHLGNYGRDLPEQETMISLLDALSLSTPEVAYRISSLEPMEIDDTLLTLMQERDNIQPHLHIPLQSGNDEILSRMGRRYTTLQFKKVVQRCRQYLPDAALGIDILAGFPGETEEQFNDCRTFLESLDFTYLHVFPYSIRPGTPAAGFTDQIPGPIKEARVAILRELSNRKKLRFYQSQLGKSFPVLVEGKRDEKDRLKGVTSNYISVLFDGPDSLLNSSTILQLIDLDGNSVLATRT